MCFGKCWISSSLLRREFKQLRKEIRRMSVETDRLTAAVDANTTKVDQLIAQGGGDGGAALAEANASMTANSEKLEATNTKLDGVIIPQPPVGG